MYKTITFSVLFLTTTIVYGQAGQFFDAPFGGGIGYVPAWYIPNLTPVNNEMKNIGMPELSTGGFYSSGIAGFIYIGFVKNLRVGGMGFGGSLSSDQTVNGINQEVIYSLGGGSVTFEYTLPFIKNFGVSVGAAIGSGSLQLDMYRNSGDFTWSGIWGELADPNINSENYYRKLKNTFWMFTPTINVDYPLYRFVVLRIGLGYQLAFADDWKADNDQSVSGVPSDLNGNSFFIQSGIFVGFFSF